MCKYSGSGHCHYGSYRLSWFLFYILNVGIYITFVMPSCTCVGEDILSHILLIFILLCSCFYWYYLLVSNKGNVLPEKYNLQPISSENGAFQFYPVLLSFYSTERNILSLYSYCYFASCSSFKLYTILLPKSCHFLTFLFLSSDLRWVV